MTKSFMSLALSRNQRGPAILARAAIKSHEPFSNSTGSLHGKPFKQGDIHFGTGQLYFPGTPYNHIPGYTTHKYANTVLTDCIERGMIDYVIFSYETPIAWHSSVVDYWEHNPSARYSATTSCHQSIARELTK